MRIVAKLEEIRGPSREKDDHSRAKLARLAWVRTREEDRARSRARKQANRILEGTQARG